MTGPLTCIVNKQGCTINSNVIEIAKAEAAIVDKGQMRDKTAL